MRELRIDEELRAWIDPLSVEEHALLEASLLQDGCRDPLVVWGGYLLDGHNRYEICKKHGIAFQTVEKTGLKTKSDVKIWMIENQLGRRNTTDFSRTTLALKLKPLLEQRAKARQVATQAQPGEQVGQVRQNSDAPTARTDEAIAQMAGVSRDTVRKVEKIMEKAAPEIIEKVRAGEISINAAAKTVQPKKPKPAPEQPAPSPEVVQPVPEDSGPTDDEIAEAVRAEADQLEYIKTLLADESDPLTAALAEIKKLRTVNAVLKSQNDGYQNTINLQIKTIKALQSKLRKLERAA